MIVDKVKLNFLNSYYYFYDWLESDNISFYKNINLYRVSSKTLNDFINNKIFVNTKILKGKYLLFSDGFTALAIMFNQEGKSLLKSSLLLEEEEKINNKALILMEENISYQILDRDEKINEPRLHQSIKTALLSEIKKIRENNEVDKLEYLYYEWFSIKEKDFNKMLTKMEKKLSGKLSNKEFYIYNLLNKMCKIV